MKTSMNSFSRPAMALALSLFLLASCQTKPEGNSSPAGEGGSETLGSVNPPSYSSEEEGKLPDPFPAPGESSTSSHDFDGFYTIRFDTRGGNPLEAIRVKKGEKAEAPADPIRAGGAFLGWYLDLSFAVSFDFAATEIHSDYWLFARYEDDEVISSGSSTTPTPDSSDTATEPIKPTGPYGPEGAQKNSWAIVGKGSIFTEDWTVAGGLSLYDNPDNPQDKGCIFYVKFAIGDTFKVSDGTTWYGYEKVDRFEAPNNYGLSHFEEKGGNSTDIVCIQSCLVDIYVNPQGNIWIQPHA